jgi:hypothetical protein
MNLPMTSHSKSLPKCFPVGAKYVVEGRAEESGELRVSSRYVVLPTGRRINVPGNLERPSAPCLASRRPRGQEKARNNGKLGSSGGLRKNFERRGTAQKHAR